MATSPDSDVVTKLNGVSGWTTGAGRNLFRGPVRPPSTEIPHAACFVLASAGPAPEAFSGSTPELRYSAVQVRTRSNAGTTSSVYVDGLTKARATRDALHHATISGYHDVRAMQTEPVYIGVDESGHHEWSINLELWHDQ